MTEAFSMPRKIGRGRSIGNSILVRGVGHDHRTLRDANKCLRANDSSPASFNLNVRSDLTADWFPPLRISEIFRDVREIAKFQQITCSLHTYISVGPSSAFS